MTANFWKIFKYNLKAKQIVNFASSMTEMLCNGYLYTDGSVLNHLSHAVSRTLCHFEPNILQKTSLCSKNTPSHAIPRALEPSGFQQCDSMQQNIHNVLRSFKNDSASKTPLSWYGPHVDHPAPSLWFQGDPLHFWDGSLTSWWTSNFQSKSRTPLELEGLSSKI